MRKYVANFSKSNSSPLRDTAPAQGKNDLLKTTSALGECVHNRIARGVRQRPLDIPRIL